MTDGGTMKTDFRVITHGHPLYMGMFTDEGNIQVANMVNLIILEATRGEFMRHELQDIINRDMHILAQNGYTEIFDTDVRMVIAARLNLELLDQMGWKKIDYFFEDWDGAA